MIGRCILCDRSTRRKVNQNRPCCRKCERSAPMAIVCPALFCDKGPAAGVARAAMAAVMAGLEDEE